MSDPTKTPNPFDILLDQVRAVVRDEIKSASGHSNSVLLTAEQLAEALQVNKATVYEWVKSNAIPYYQAGRFVRFNLQEVLEKQRNASPS